MTPVTGTTCGCTSRETLRALSALLAAVTKDEQFWEGQRTNSGVASYAQGRTEAARQVRAALEAAGVTREA